MNDNSTQKTTGKPLTKFTTYPKGFMTGGAAALGLDPTDIAIVLHLRTYQYHPAYKPRRTDRQVAACIGVSRETVNIHKAKLEKLGLLETKTIPLNGRNFTTEWDLGELWMQLGESVGEDIGSMFPIKEIHRALGPERLAEIEAEARTDEERKCQASTV